MAFVNSFTSSLSLKSNKRLGVYLLKSQYFEFIRFFLIFKEINTSSFVIVIRWPSR
jgi:hypothetical protein